MVALRVAQRRRRVKKARPLYRTRSSRFRVWVVLMTVVMVSLVVGGERSSQRRLHVCHLSKCLLLFLALLLGLVVPCEHPEVSCSTRTRCWTPKRDRRRQHSPLNWLFLARSRRWRGQQMLKVAVHHRHRIEISSIPRLGAPWSTVIVGSIPLGLSCSSERRHRNPLPSPQILDMAA